MAEVTPLPRNVCMAPYMAQYMATYMAILPENLGTTESPTKETHTNERKPPCDAIVARGVYLPSYNYPYARIHVKAPRFAQTLQTMHTATIMS